MTYDDKLKALAEIISTETLAELNRTHPGYSDWTSQAATHIHHGAKYARIDVGTSGKYMVDQAGNIYGIKAYGVVHRGHQYGTLDTIHNYFWGGYRAVLKAERKVVRLAAHNGKPEGYIVMEMRR